MKRCSIADASLSPSINRPCCFTRFGHSRLVGKMRLVSLLRLPQLDSFRRCTVCHDASMRDGSIRLLVVSVVCLGMARGAVTFQRSHLKRPLPMSSLMGIHSSRHTRLRQGEVELYQKCSEWFVPQPPCSRTHAHLPRMRTHHIRLDERQHDVLYARWDARASARPSTLSPPPARHPALDASSLCNTCSCISASNLVQCLLVLSINLSSRPPSCARCGAAR